MTLLLILGSLALIILGMFYIGWGTPKNNLEENIRKQDYKEAQEYIEKASHKVNPRTLSLRAQKCIKGLHIVYVHDLETVTISQLHSVKGVGKTTATEIEDWALLNYDVMLKEKDFVI